MRVKPAMTTFIIIQRLLRTTKIATLPEFRGDREFASVLFGDWDADRPSPVPTAKSMMGWSQPSADDAYCDLDLALVLSCIVAGDQDALVPSAIIFPAAFKNLTRLRPSCLAAYN